MKVSTSEAVSAKPLPRTCTDQYGNPKSRFTSKKEAKRALQKIATFNNKKAPKRIGPKEIYPCPNCGYYHLAKRMTQRGKSKEVSPHVP